MKRKQGTRMTGSMCGFSVEGLEPRVLFALSAAIEGITMLEDVSNNFGFYSRPPDPHGAAGPNHIVSVVNRSIEWHTKANVQQNSQRLGFGNGTATGSFFGALQPVNGLFDPKVIYDDEAGRFVVVGLERDESAQTSRILIAASDDADPNGTWYYQAMDSETTIGGVATWADYPGLAVDEEAIYLTANMFEYGGGDFRGTRLWIVNKDQFYAGGQATISLHDPGGTPGPELFTLQPAQILDATGLDSSIGTFFVQFGWYDGGSNNGQDSEVFSVFRVDNPLTATPSFSQELILLGSIHNEDVELPDAPQLGSTSLIQTNDWRTLQAVWRDNVLYVVNTVVPPSGQPDAGQATAHWAMIDTANLGDLELIDQGNIGGETLGAGTHTFFPSIAVNAANDVAISFAASGSSIHPGAYYVTRTAEGAAGVFGQPWTLAAGQDVYDLDAGPDRWGDYSSVSVDPADGTFWAFNEYAMERTQGYGGVWGTRWGKFTAQAERPTLRKAYANGSPLINLAASWVRNGPAVVANGTRLTVAGGTGTAHPEPGATLRFYHKRPTAEIGTPLATVSLDAGGQYRRIALNFTPGKTYSLFGVVTDAAGNRSILGRRLLYFNVPKDAPTASGSAVVPVPPDGSLVIAGIGDTAAEKGSVAYTSDRTLVFHGFGAPWEEVTITEPTLQLSATAFVEDDGKWTIDLSGTVLDDGMYEFTATSDTGRTDHFEVDVGTDEAAPIIDEVATDLGEHLGSGQATRASETWTFTGHGIADETVSLHVRGGDPPWIWGANDVVDGNGQWAIEIELPTEGLADGPYDFVARSASYDSATFRVVADGTAPAIAHVWTLEAATGHGIEELTLSFSEPIDGLELSKLQLLRDGSGPNLLGPGQLLTGEGDEWTLSNLGGLTSTPGEYVLSLAADSITDMVGNTGPSGGGGPIFAFAIVDANAASAGDHEIWLEASGWAGLQVLVDGDPVHQWTDASLIHQIIVLGGDGDDQLTLAAPESLLPADGVLFLAAAGIDEVNVLGTSGDDVIQFSDGEIVFAATDWPRWIEYTDVEQVDLTSSAGADDVSVFDTAIKLGGATAWGTDSALSLGSGTVEVVSDQSFQNLSVLEEEAGTLVVGSGHSATVNGTLSIETNGTLTKSGSGTLVIAGSQSHASAAALEVDGGTVELNSNAGTPAAVGTPAVANLSITVNDGLLKLGADQDVAGLAVIHTNSGRQSLDLASPAGDYLYRAMRVYASDLAAAELSLWASLLNANMAGAPDPLDGIYDSGKSLHTNSAIGLTDQAVDVAGIQHVFMRLTRLADFNVDGTTNFPDNLILSQNYNGTYRTWDQGDCTYDGNTNINDLLKLSQNYNQVFV